MTLNPKPWRVLQGEEWKKTTLKTALLFPGVVFCIFFALNMLVWGQRSSGAVPFGTLFALCFLWFGISVPLVFIGSYFGYKKPAAEVRARGRGRQCLGFSLNPRGPACNCEFRVRILGIMSRSS